MPTPRRSGCWRNSSRCNRTTRPCSSSARGWPRSGPTLTLLQDSVTRLGEFVGTWPPEAVERYNALQQASGAGNAPDAARATAFLRNVLARVPSFRDSRARVTQAAELIAEPFTRFVRLATPVATPSAPDTALAFAREPIGDSPTALWLALAVFSLDGDQRPVVLAADDRQVQRVDGPGLSLPIS